MTDLSPSREGGPAQQGSPVRSQGSESLWQGRRAESYPLIIVIAVLTLVLGLSVLFVHPRITLAVAALLAVGSLMLRAPYVGLLAYVAILYLRPEEMGALPIAMHVERIVAICLAFAVILSALANRVRRLPPSAVNWAIIAGLGAILASVPLAYWRGGAVSTALEFAKLCFLYFAITFLVRDTRQLRGLLWVAMVVWAIHGGAAWIGYIRGTTIRIGEQHVVRALGATSRFGGANDVAYLLVVALAFLVVLVRAERSPLARVAMVAMSIICLGGALLTGSRSALLGVMFLVVVVSWRSRRRLLVAAGMAVLVIVGWVLTPPTLQGRYRTVTTYTTEATWIARLEGWKVGGRMLIEHPLFGVGAGNFGAVRHASYDSYWLEPHSVYVQVAAELGVLGIACFGAFIWLVFRENRRLRQALRGISAAPGVAYAEGAALALETALVMLLFLGITGHNMYNPNYYLVAGLTVALGSIVRGWAEDAERAVPAAEEAAAG